jgi:hypothetical protein
LITPFHSSVLLREFGTLVGLISAVASPLIQAAWHGFSAVVISVTKEGVKFTTSGDIGSANVVCRQNNNVDNKVGFCLPLSNQCYVSSFMLNLPKVNLALAVCCVLDEVRGGEYQSCVALQV